MEKVIPVLMILLPMVLACICWLLLRRREKAFYWAALGTAAVEFLLAVINVCSGGDGASFEVLLSGITQSLVLQVDGFRRLYCLLIAFMWLMSLALSHDYFRGHHHIPRYLFFTLMTLGATMGVFLAGDLLTAFIFFEVMSFTSFPWVIQEETEGAIRAANTYLAVAVIGGLTALMGIFLLENRLGTTELSKLYDAASACTDKTVLYIAGGCILFGFGAKAGMFPLHIWLPKAYPVAPAPASALLSGVLTKSGIWGVLALSAYIFRNDPAWGMVILSLGAVTMLLGAVLALFSIDLKRTLACSSMSQIGFILTGIGMMCLLGEENSLAAGGTLLHMVNHSLFKLVLFLSAGAIYMQAHTLDLNELRGFGRKKPFLMVCFLTAAAGIAGIPGLSGYISKTLLHEAIVEGAAIYGGALTAVEWVFLISGGLTLAYMTKLFICIFIERGAGEKRVQDHAVHGTARGRYPSVLTWIAIGSGAVLLPVMGLFPHQTMDRLAKACTDFFCAAEFSGGTAYFSLESLKGAAISIGIGILIYLLFVRRCMMKNGAYVDCWPKKLDLEELIYRPLLLKVLAAVFGMVSAVFAENRITGAVCRFVLRAAGIAARAVSDLVDALILLLSRTVFRRIVPLDTRGAVRSPSYRFGALLDRLLKKQPGREEHYYAHRAYQTSKTLKDTTHDLTDTVSFALLMLVLAIAAVLTYVLLIRG